MLTHILHRTQAAQTGSTAPENHVGLYAFREACMCVAIAAATCMNLCCAAALTFSCVPIDPL